jgi:membrane-anchored protein YejM (alkaline phosphatase superfamily)
MKPINYAFLKQLYLQFVFNFFVVLIIALPYLSYIENDNEIKAKIYFYTTTLSHFFLLAALPLLVSMVLYLISKSIKLSSIIFMTLMIIVLVVLKIDANIFNQFRYHLSPIVFSLLFGKRASDIFQFSSSNVITGVLFIVGLILMQLLFFYLAKKIIARKNKFYIKKTLAFFLICLLYSHIMFAWADVNFYRPILQYKNVYPAFFPLTAEGFMTKLGLVDEELIKKNKKISQNQTQNSVQYPLKTITSIPVENKKDILFINIDSWRFDCLTEEITPNINKFAAQSQLFHNHNSGSNMTTGGIFSLFYGIPATYFDSFTGIEKSPVFIDELQKQNYEIGVFSSSTIENPPFDRNVFIKVKDIRLFSDGVSPSERDLDVTKDWMAFDKKRDRAKPSFSFLFYDAAHGFDYPESYTIPFKPSLAEVDFLDLNDSYDAKPLINRYKNALHFIDNEVAKVIEHLKSQNKLENTLIVITGDHGQEFNDNKKGYWQHGGNFSKFQIQVPMIIYDASKEAKEYNHLTLHYDIVPSIMKNYLGITTNIGDFSVGQNIFENKKRDWFVCGYNQKYSVIEQNKITNIYTSGLFDITDLKLNVLNHDLNYDVIEHAFAETNKFYIKKK